MFGPIWLARHTFRGVSRRRSCDQTVQVVSNKQAAKTLFWVTAPLTVPMTLAIGLGLGGAAVNAIANWPLWHQPLTTTLANEWHHPGAGLVLGAVAAVLGGLLWLGLKTSKPEPRTAIGFYPCCGMATGTAHATTCRIFRQPPENPAKWSNRR